MKMKMKMISGYYLITHDIGQQHHMSVIDRHTMIAHCTTNFFNNSRSRRFNSQRILYLKDVVGFGILA